MKKRGRERKKKRNGREVEERKKEKMKVIWTGVKIHNQLNPSFAFCFFSHSVEV